MSGLRHWPSAGTPAAVFEAGSSSPLSMSFSHTCVRKVKPASHCVDQVSNTTQRPPAETLGRHASRSDCTPASSTLASSTAPVTRS